MNTKSQYVERFSLYKHEYNENIDKCIITYSGVKTAWACGSFSYQRIFMVNNKTYVVLNSSCYLLTHDVTDKKFMFDLYLANPDIELKTRTRSRTESRSGCSCEREYFNVEYTDYYTDDQEPHLVMSESNGLIYHGDNPLMKIPKDTQSSFWYGELFTVDGYIYMFDQNKFGLFKIEP